MGEQLKPNEIPTKKGFIKDYAERDQLDAKVAKNETLTGMKIEADGRVTTNEEAPKSVDPQAEEEIKKAQTEQKGWFAATFDAINKALE